MVVMSLNSVHYEVKLGELLGPQVKAATKASMIPATRMPCWHVKEERLKDETLQNGTWPN